MRGLFFSRVLAVPSNHPPFCKSPFLPAGQISRKRSPQSERKGWTIRWTPVEPPRASNHTSYFYFSSQNSSWCFHDELSTSYKRALFLDEAPLKKKKFEKIFSSSFSRATPPPN